MKFQLLIIALSFPFLFFNCSSSNDADPNIMHAPEVSNIQVNDIANNGNGSDMEISFDKVLNEDLISEYRILVVNKSDESSFDLSAAEAVTSNSYTSLLPDGNNKKVILNENSNDADGNLIEGSKEYVVFVMSVADGTNTTGNNALSAASSSIILEIVIIDAPSVGSVSANYVTTQGDGRDLLVTFDKVQDESLISEYRIFVVKNSVSSSFDLIAAEGVATNNFESISTNDSNVSLILQETSTDTDGDLITVSIEYVVFVLTVADGVNAQGKNGFSAASNSVTLINKNFEMYVSDAGNFSTPPWQILKFDRNGQNPEVFISDNLNWPQDILFQETSNTVLISNLGSNKITKHNATTGAYISDFATGISGPTRMKIGPDNLLYVLQWSGNGKVFRYNLDGTFVDEFTSSGVNQSIGLDWDNEGNLYVSSYNGDAVRKFDANGADQGDFISSNLVGPTNIWFDTNGDLLVSDYDGTAVKRFDASGNYLGDFLKGLSNSEGIAYFPNGNFYIGNGASKSVKMFNRNGDFIKDFISSGAGNLLSPNAVIIREIE